MALCLIGMIGNLVRASRMNKLKIARVGRIRGCLLAATGSVDASFELQTWRKWKRILHLTMLNI